MSGLDAGNRFGGYFASGSNKAGEIAGLAALGRNIGVAVNCISKAAIEELESLAGTGLDIFVDSGAFGEVEFLDDGTRIVKSPITDKKWRKRLGTMERLAQALGSSLYVVAPDSVGDQAETLERLERYRWNILKIRAAGARIIVPIQRGAMPAAEFAAAIEQILGFSDWIRGIPLKKAATTHRELEAFGATLEPGTEVHLLGKGPYSDDYEICMSAVAHCAVRCDSVRIRSLVGRTNGRGGGPRALTVAQDVVRARLQAAGLELDDYTIRRDAVIAVLGPETRAAMVAAASIAA